MKKMEKRAWNALALTVAWAVGVAFAVGLWVPSPEDLEASTEITITKTEGGGHFTMRVFGFTGGGTRTLAAAPDVRVTVTTRPTRRAKPDPDPEPEGEPITAHEATGWAFFTLLALVCVAFAALLAALLAAAIRHLCKLP